jgi:glycerophosphoryl diester phosphodiesterase
VESIDNSGARLIQTLQLKTGGPDERVFDWVVDRGQKCLYALALIKGTKDTPQSIIITKLPLPPLNKPEVNFEKSDILDQFTVTFPNLTQGATVRDGFLYMPVGLHDIPKGTKEWRSREIIVINLKTRKIQRRIDLNASVPEEPEDADFHGDTLLLYCGQKGGLYKVDTKDPAATGGNAPRLHTVNIQSLAELQEYFHYSPDKDLIISGHRGGMMAGYPENCIASCEKTLSLMPSFFEIDPRLTKDGVLVLMHDATLNRTTTGKGKVSDHTCAELRQFYLKDRQKNATPCKIPTLDEVLEWGAGKTVFNFDNKGVPWQVYSDNLRGKWAKYHNIILSVRSLEECLFYYQRNDNVMFCCEIGDMAQYEAYRDSGIPWNRIMAYVRYTMDPEQQAVHDLLHGHGVMCMIAAGPTADKVKPDGARIEAYKKELSRNPDIIETDYPADFAGLSRKRTRK